MRGFRVRRRLLVLVSSACLLGLAACGGDGGSGDEGEGGDSAVVAEPTRLGFYDWEPNVIPNPDASPDNATEAPFARIYDAVQLASGQKPECFQDRCTASGPAYYAFDAQSKQLLAGPSPAKTGLFTEEPDGKPGSETLAVPRGTIVVQGDAPRDDYFVLRDRPELSAEDISNPEVLSDPTTNQPAIAFEFTEAGQFSFQELTKRVAERPRDIASPGIDAAAAASLSGHFAVILDDQVIARPIVNFVENPQGIDGSNGASLGGSFSTDEAEELVRFLEANGAP